MKLPIFDRLGLVYLNLILTAVALEGFIFVIEMATTRGLPLVGW